MSQMKDILSKVFIFAAGAAVGVIATREYFKTKYEKIAQDDINSVTEQLLNENYKNADITDENIDEVLDENSKYRNIIEELGYDYTTKNKEEEILKGKRVISLEEFEDGENPTITLYYWEDGVVTNDRNRIIKNVDELIGLKSLEQFDDYSIDSVYVRNYDSEVDYEILRDSRCFSEIS